jgi:hypothetical protein
MISKRAVMVALSLAVAGLAGCSGGGPLAPLPVVEPGRGAELVVIRPSGVFACGVSYPVTIDGRAVYALPCGEHVALVVPAGERIFGVKHHVWFSEDENTTTVHVEAGRRYFLRLDSTGPMSGPVLNRIGDDAGRALMSSTTPRRL